MCNYNITESTKDELVGTIEQLKNLNNMMQNQINNQNSFIYNQRIFINNLGFYISNFQMQNNTHENTRIATIDETRTGKDLQARDYITTSSQIKNLPEVVLDYLIWNLFLIGGANLLVSKHGLGKSLLSIAISMSNKIQKKTLFFLLEDFSGYQLQRYYKTLPEDNFLIITRKDWKKWCEDVKLQITQNIDKDAFAQAIVEYNTDTRFMKSYKKIYRQLLAQNGITKEERYNPVLCYMMFIDKLQDKISLVVIDTFLAFQDGKRFSRQQLAPMVEATSSLGITSLWLHHVNAKNEIEGSNELSRVVDNSYILDKYLDESGDDLLKLSNEKMRNPNLKDVILKRTYINDFVAEFEAVEYLDPNTINTKKTKNISEIVIDIIESYGTEKISFSELLDSTLKIKPGINDGSIRNILPKIKSNNFSISMADGNTWKEISIHRS